MVSFDQSLLASLSLDYDVSLTSTSYLGVGEGDIVVLTYPRKSSSGTQRTNLTRIGFIMSTSKSKGGFRLSSRMNTLLNFVDAEQISDTEFLDIVNRLYTKDLEPVLSEFAYAANKDVGSFKTLNVQEISGTGVFKVNLKYKEPE